MNCKLKKISGDASFREFYRLKKNNKTSIIVSAKKDKYKNLIVYSVINNILNSNKIYAPRLISNYYINNMIEISDLGDKSFYDFIISKKNKLNGYKSLIKLIIKIQKIKIKKVYELGKFKVKLSKYTSAHLHKESDLFFDWYLKYTLKKKKISKIKKLLRTELNKIFKKLNFKNDTFVQRDFHISNIMLSKKKLGVIDSQDAIIGNPLYDVASLIDDVRIKLTQDLQNKLFEFYCKNSKYKKEKTEKLKNDFDILSVQRNLKILGIFVRLSKRDKKLNYLKYLPYTWALIERRMKNPIFNKLNILFKKHLPLKKLKTLRRI
ncbi:phosphotransferase [Pelagibacteraceae bacterium]|nr:phosphotransferase [Pelagibacteraceae bacterium]